jgi:hypothetical protein
MEKDMDGGIGKNDTYTVEKSEIGHVGGRYISKSPLAAAKKVATQLFKIIKKSATYKKYMGKTISFSIRRTTQNSDKKVFEYTAKYSKLKKPIQVVINGVTIEYKNSLIVKKKKQSNKKPSKKGGCCGKDKK